VPSTREVPSGPNAEESAFAEGLAQGQFQIVIFMTGVGTRALAQAIEPEYPREQWVAALSKVAVVARGPKPVAVLREFGVPVTLTVPEPNTWREILRRARPECGNAATEGRPRGGAGTRGTQRELYAGLSERGAQVFAVPVYKWRRRRTASPAPLRDAILGLALGKFDVALFTSSVQVHHCSGSPMKWVSGRQLWADYSAQIVGSIGPVTSETLREYGITPDLEPFASQDGLSGEGDRGAECRVAAGEK